MTRFVGEAVGHRRGQGRDNRVKKMEAFLEGKGHEDLELAQRLREHKVKALPDHDPHRSFVFMDIAIGIKPAGRIIIELYDDIIPVGAGHLRNRCLPGSHVGIKGCLVERLVPHYAAFFGKNPVAGEGIRLRPVNDLRALEPGTVSVSMSGDEVAISLARALALDTNDFQVVGRVYKGKEVIEMLNEVSTGADSTPYQKIVITNSGATNSRGDQEESESIAAAPVTSKEAMARLKEESAMARSAVLDALEEGLKKPKGEKRKAEDSNERSIPGPSTQVNKKTRVKSRALDEMLGMSDEESDKEE